MGVYITVDGGTTNTRVNLVKDNKVVECIKYKFGVKSCIGGNDRYKNMLKEGISALLKKYNVKPKRILASGMITSEFGLLKLGHIKAPAGITELSQSMEEKVFSEISDIPFSFIRGVKMEGCELDSIDIMRGEETEIFGVAVSDGVFVLTGSHSKIITVKNGKIIDFKTMLTGEMLESLASNTILSASLDLKSDIMDEYLIKGFEYCKAHGINESLFKVRVLDTIVQKSKDEIYSFYVGAVLSHEIEYILSVKTDRIVVCGNRYIKEAEYVLLKELSTSSVEMMSDDDVSDCVALGAVKIYENKLGVEL